MKTLDPKKLLSITRITPENQQELLDFLSNTVLLGFDVETLWRVSSHHVCFSVQKRSSATGAHRYLYTVQAPADVRQCEMIDRL